MATGKKRRNPKGDGYIRERSDGRYEGKYTVGRDPGTGKQIQKSVYGKTENEVRKKLKQITMDIDNGVYIEPSKMTVRQWLDIWLDEYNKEVKTRTLNLYRGQCDYRIKPALGAMKLTAVRPHDIQMFLNKQGEETPDKPALAPKSIKNLHGILHKAFEQALLCGYIKSNPSTACKLPRCEKPDIQPLDNQQIASFLEAIKGHPFEMLYKTGVFTGMRQGELLGLTWDCINFTSGTIHIHRQLQLIKGTYHFSSLKNDKTRTITPAQAVMKPLWEHRKHQLEMQLQAGEAWSNPDNFVFTDEVGRHLARQTVYHGFKRIVKDMGIPNMRFHDMRHSYAVASIQAGDDPKTVQENMGHHTAAFTLNIYGHVNETMKRDSAARLDKFIESIASERCV